MQPVRYLLTWIMPADTELVNQIEPGKRDAVIEKLQKQWIVFRIITSIMKMAYSCSNDRCP